MSSTGREWYLLFESEQQRPSFYFPLSWSFGSADALVLVDLQPCGVICSLQKPQPCSGPDVSWHMVLRPQGLVSLDPDELIGSPGVHSKRTQSTCFFIPRGRAPLKCRLPG